MKQKIEEQSELYRLFRYNEMRDNGTYSDLKRLADQAEVDYKAGYIDALSLFKWRKVSEELPPLDVYVLTKRKRKCDNKEYPALNKMYFEPKANKVIWEMELPDTSTTIEWMPIPK